MANVMVGVGVVLYNEKGQVLLCKRISKHGNGSYSIPGGSVELGEEIESCAAREVQEETGILLNKFNFIGVTNNLKTYQEEGVHSVSIIFSCNDFSGDPIVLEPTKHESWEWHDINTLPSPQFEASALAIKLHLTTDTSQQLL